MKTILDNFKDIYGFEFKGKVSDATVVELSSDKGAVKREVINYLNIIDGEYNFSSFASHGNESTHGKLVIKNGICTMYCHMWPKGKVVDNFMIEDFIVNGKTEYLPVLCLGEHPIIIE